MIRKIFRFIFSKYFFKKALIFSLYSFILSIFLVIVLRFIPVYFTPLMFIRSAQSIFAKEIVGINHQWVSFDKISKSMKTAVIKAEDYKFFQHNGFDFEAISKAIEYNKKHKNKKGASTISQQTAKNVFLWPSRSYLRKGLEAYFTVLIEFIWPKERILEVYLNVIELGPGVYGVESAANKYFKKSANKLSTAEASLMAAVLPNPIKFKINKPSRYVLKRQRRIMGRSLDFNKISNPIEIEKEAKKESMDFFDLKFDPEEEKEMENKDESIPSSEPNSEVQIKEQ